MIRLITGLPGHGKTLWAVAQLLDERKRESGRPLFVDGISGLKMPHQVIDGTRWQDAPDGALIVIDEAQRVFPTRGTGTPPAHVAALATHRHRGIDIWLITQHPGNIDSFIRERLIEDHVHLFRTAGLQAAVVYRWAEVQTDLRSDKVRESALQSPFVYPKAVYDEYTSAVLHTARRRVPVRKLAVLIAGLCGVPLLLWAAISSVGPSVEAPATVSAVSAQPAPPRQEGPRQMTADEWLARYEPRVSYRPESAPAYDASMASSVPPRLVCIEVELAGCSCYTEQATPWTGVPLATCRRLARDGLYQPVLRDG